MKDYIAKAERYMDGVLSGDVPACEYVKQAVRRQAKDLEDPDLPYIFDEYKACHVCAFIERLPNVKGEWAGQTIELADWQCFLLTTVFGWIDENDCRRFKIAYVEVPRKNGKSSLSSGVALYMMMADGEAGAEVYAAGVNREQARIVWEDAKRMVEKSPGMRKAFGVEAMARSIIIPNEGCTFKALSRDQGGNLDGLNVHCAIVDEIHAHKTRDIWDVLETATGSRRSPLIWGITTAGFNRAGICYEQRRYTLSILNESHKDEEYFGIVYTIDEEDDWTDPNIHQKANPNWGVSVKPDDIARKCRKAVELASAQNNFLTKHLNCWVNADVAWMNMQEWVKRGDSNLKLERFTGSRAWIGMDLATKKDICSVAILIEEDEQLYLFFKHYLSEWAVEQSGNSQYSGWSREGYIETTTGNTTDFEAIEGDILRLCEQLSVQEVAFDPWQGGYLAQRLQREARVPLVEIRQTVAHMSEPMKQLEAYVLDGRLTHNNCPVATWMMSNVVCHTDKKDNIYPNKEAPENKIDGIVAAIMAVNRHMAETQRRGYTASVGLMVI